MHGGIVANLAGPYEGCMHDAMMFYESGLLANLQRHAVDVNGNQFCVFGDSAYPIDRQVITPFKGVNITPAQHDFNRVMQKLRISVEWVFGDIVNVFKFVDFKKNIKIGLSPVGRIYQFCELMHNARCCIYANKSSEYFD